jgi:hypothetical protein
VSPMIGQLPAPPGPLLPYPGEPGSGLNIGGAILSAYAPFLIGGAVLLMALVMSRK